jgi:hypothetical protein
LIKPNNNFSIDNRYRSAAISEGKQLLQSLSVLTNILVNEGYPLLRKKLFLPVTRPSARLVINDYGFGHCTSFGSEILI